MKTFALVLFAVPMMTFGFINSSFAGPASKPSLQQTKQLIAEKAPGYVRVSLEGRLQNVEKSLAELERSLNGMEKSIQTYVPAENRALFTATLIELRAALAKDLTKAPAPVPPKETHNGFFCTSACKDQNGAASLYITGVAGLDRLLTQQAANDQLSTVYRCGQGLVEMGCEVRSHSPTAFTCQAACADADGQPMISYAAVGQGFSEGEAFANASINVAGKWRCQNGIAKYKCVKN